MKNAFTMIELVFVIVVLGILASLAIPKFAATRTDAQIATARATIASIRSAIVSERQTRIIMGDSSYISGIKLNEGTGLFGGVLMYSITAGTDDGDWSSESESNATNTYDYKLQELEIRFTYTQSTGRFECDTTNVTYGDKCELLLN